MNDLQVCSNAIVPPDGSAAAVLVDKPAGWTSYDVIRKLRTVCPDTKMGHTGTLDPIATGLLIVLMNRATKSMNHFMHLDKHYEATIRLGQTTASFDAETPVIRQADAGEVSLSAIDKACQQLTGVIAQTPPMYSAVKVKGERLYKKARRGETVDRKPNQVTVHRFRAVRRTGDDLQVKVHCSKGTYIRALAHDLGQLLEVGAHLVALRRTAIGSWTVADAWPLNALVEALSERKHEA
ncbi:MAG: tRNA pseudouridine(55) synthase TruB [Bacteroidota bacterium]|nr:tRNA pseudouridine(55) synthase TruB [Bacteroidota bacterium]